MCTPSLLCIIVNSFPKLSQRKQAYVSLFGQGGGDHIWFIFSEHVLEKHVVSDRLGAFVPLLATPLESLNLLLL